MGIKVNLRDINESLKLFIEVLSSVINTTKNDFSTFVNQHKFELKFNAQSIYLSEYLNQVFDPAQKRIYIINDATLLEVYVYTSGENILPEDQIHVYRDSETIPDSEQIYLDRSGFLDKDFQVVLPAALSSLQADSVFLASIRKYSLPDKIFEVIVI